MHVFFHLFDYLAEAAVKKGHMCNICCRKDYQQRQHPYEELSALLQLIVPFCATRLLMNWCQNAYADRP